MTEEQIKPGTKVHYNPKFGDKENGIIKSANPDNSIVFVVYKCNNDWSNYKYYTGQATDIKDLKIGWV